MSFVQGAILSDAVLYKAQLVRADLRNSRLERISADGADLRGANLESASLGVEPMLTGHTGGVTSVSFAPDGHTLVYVKAKLRDETVSPVFHGSDTWTDDQELAVLATVNPVHGHALARTITHVTQRVYTHSMCIRCNVAWWGCH